MATQAKRIDSSFYVEGYATTFDAPYLLDEWDGIKYYEIIDRNALTGADMSDVIMQYDHSGSILARMSNGTLGIEPDNNGLFIYADLSKGAPARDMYEMIANELVTRMSWAFIIERESYNRETRTRTIEKIKKVYDVSAVSIPANGDTEISARSFVDGVIGIAKREALVRSIKLSRLKNKLEVLKHES